MTGLTRARVLRLADYFRPSPEFAIRVPLSVPNTRTTTGVIFSRNRPMQLQALLDSISRMAVGLPSLKVIYAASTLEFKDAYSSLAAHPLLGNIQFQNEEVDGGFRKCLLKTLEQIGTKTCFFLVDDVLFIRPVSFDQFAGLANSEVIPSMRLGQNITHSYTLASGQPRPSFRHFGVHLPGTSPEGHLLAWRWKSGFHDWGYPYSLDGNIFETESIRKRIGRISFHGPNSLEASLNAHPTEQSAVWGICFPQSRMVNVPLNRVQDEVPNRHGSLGSDELLRMWQRGARIDVSGLHLINVSSVHEEVPLSFVFGAQD